jgi:hypothetical protein
MTANEPDAEGWRRLFAALTGDAAVDAGIVRAFCDNHHVTPARVMAEMHARRRTDPADACDNEDLGQGS